MEKHKLLVIDGAPLASPTPSGISFLTANMINAIASGLPKDTRLKVFLPLGKKLLVDSQWNLNDRIELCTLPLPLRIINALQRRRALPPIDLFFGRGVYLFTNYRLLKISKSSKAITYVHDAAYALYPDTLEEVNRKHLQREVPFSFEHSDIIITLTETSKRELITQYPAGGDKIQVVGCGVDVNQFTHSDTSTTLKTIGVEKKKYYLTVGNIEPRKNLEYVLDVYKAAVDKHVIPKSHPLVIVGWAGWNDEGIRSKVSQLKVAGYSIILPSHKVTTPQLGALYKSAINTLCFSVHEGFGMVPIESMSCGTVPIVSDISVFHEVCGDAAYYVTLNDVNRAVEQLSEFLTRKTDATIIKKMSSRYTWASAASKVITIEDKLQAGINE